MNDWNLALAGLQEACRDTFGVPVSYIPSVANRPERQGQAVTLTAIFDENREMVNIMSGGSGGMDAVIPRPVLSLRRVDLGFDPLEGDEVILSNILYRVIDVQPDGAGMFDLILNRSKDLF